MQDEDWQSELRLRETRKNTARRILGVSDADGHEAIKRAWRRLSLQHHPDRNSGSGKSHQEFVLVNSAYRCLTQGKDCEQLDSLRRAKEELPSGKYRLDNPWGYFAWWRDTYFGREKGD